MSTIKGVMVYKNSKFSISKGIACRECRCFGCGDIISKGDKRIVATLPNYTNGVSLHCGCLNNFKQFKTISNGSVIDSNNTKNHSIEIIASAFLKPYFQSVGYETIKHSPTHRKYILSNQTNAYNSGHTISTALKFDNVKIFVIVDGVKTEILNKADFDRLTKKYY